MIVVVDSGVANAGSILNMLARLGASATVSADPEVIEKAEKLVLPGVGSFDAGMRSLEERGLIGLLNKQVMERGVPILGLCLGMQMLTLGSEEGTRPGLGWINTRVIRFRFVAGAKERVPHMGWNVVAPTQEHPLFSNFDADAKFYFVHSYHIPLSPTTDTLGVTRHGVEFASVVGRKNITGVQFHPEKSHRFGMRLFQNFIAGW